jgi:hypothetical protein
MNEDLKTHGPAGTRELLAAQGAPDLLAKLIERKPRHASR